MKGSSFDLELGRGTTLVSGDTVTIGYKNRLHLRLTCKSPATVTIDGKSYELSKIENPDEPTDVKYVLDEMISAAKSGNTSPCILDVPWTGEVIMLQTSDKDEFPSPLELSKFPNPPAESPAESPVETPFFPRT